MHTPRIALVWQIMIGLLAGIAIGALLHRFPESRPWLVDNILQPAGDIFIKLMKMIVVPIVFSCMVVGIAGQGDGKSLGRIGVKSLSYFFCITTLAIIIGLVMGNLLKPAPGQNCPACTPPLSPCPPATARAIAWGRSSSASSPIM